MRYRKLSSTGDYTFGAGQLNFWINTPDGVAQAVQTTILLWVGEWYLDVTDGTPFLQGIIGKHSQATADSVLQDRILGVQVIDQNGDSVAGVVNIEDYSSTIDPVTRRFSVSATLNTIFGVTTIEVANYANY